MAAPLVSVALCTYNGEAFLQEQLNSLLGQSYPNIEIIIADDCSTDGTVAIISGFALKNPRIKLYQNTVNLGYTKNFEKAIKHCSGEFIALADQDDIWEAGKLTEMVNAIGDNMLAYHDSAFIDEKGEPLNRKLSDIRNCYSGTDSRVFLFDNCVLGHATLFKRAMLAYLGDFNDKIIHDRWLAYAGTNNGGIVFIDKPLVKYRQHSNANTNILKQQRVNTRLSSSVEKMDFQLEVTRLFVSYPFNNHAVFKTKLLTLLEERAINYTSFKLAWFIFKHRNTLFFIQKKSAISRIAQSLKYIWGYKIKRLPLFNKQS